MKLVASVFVLTLAGFSRALENGLMRTPPMGWLAWERFRCNIDCKNDPQNCISEKLFMEMADRLVTDGWKDLGYVYVNIDDCWTAKGRDPTGQLVPDPERFPSGIKALADYVHALGLKLGIYGDLGTYTCGGYPGTTLDQIERDALTFAEWGVDMLKLDGCYSSAEDQAQGYPRMTRALNATGRLIAYSCSWPAYRGGLPPQFKLCRTTYSMNHAEMKRLAFHFDAWEWGAEVWRANLFIWQAAKGSSLIWRCPSETLRMQQRLSLLLNVSEAESHVREKSLPCPAEGQAKSVMTTKLADFQVNYTLLTNICNLWRNYGDIQDSWDSVLSIVDWFSRHQDVLQPAAGPGHWNDPDMLIIGNFGLSEEESRSQMALWTMLAAPLFLSTDLRRISQSSREILQNKLMIKINQDPLGIQGRRILREKSYIEVFQRPLSYSASALVFFSRRTDMPYRYTTSLACLNYTHNAIYEVQDVYTGDIISGLKTADNFTVVINPSGVVMWYLYPTMYINQVYNSESKGFHPFPL